MPVSESSLEEKGKNIKRGCRAIIIRKCQENFIVNCILSEEYFVNEWLSLQYLYPGYLLVFPLVWFSSLVPCEEEKKIKRAQHPTLNGASDHLADDAVEMLEMFPLQEGQPYPAHPQFGHLARRQSRGFSDISRRLPCPGWSPCRQR